MMNASIRNSLLSNNQTDTRLCYWMVVVEQMCDCVELLNCQGGYYREVEREDLVQLSSSNSF